jgi:small subunit ribosomal protein S17
MAEETPENIVEEVQGAASAAPGEATAGGEAEGRDTDATESPEAGAAAAEPEAPAPAPAAPAGQTRRERLETRRAARRPAQRGPVTPEERDAERRARRAETAKQRRAYRAKLKQRRAATQAERPAPEADRAPDRGPGGRPKVRQGVVVSSKADKTITVAIDVVQRHRRYRKIMRSTVRLHAHDENNVANEGDTVRVVECRPMSRSKRWRLTDVVERAR